MKGRHDKPFPGHPAEPGFSADELTAKLQLLCQSPRTSDVSSGEAMPRGVPPRPSFDPQGALHNRGSSSSGMESASWASWSPAPRRKSGRGGSMDVVVHALGLPDVLVSISRHIAGADLPAWSLTCRRFRDGVVAAGRGRERLPLGGLVVNLGITKWALAQDFLPADRVCELACLDGSAEVLAWGLSRGFPAGWRCWRAAARGGHVPILRALDREGVPWESEQVLEEILEEVENIVRELDPAQAQRQVPPLLGSCATAACHGHLPALQFLRSVGCPWDWTTLGMGCLFGHLDVVRWSSMEGCDWSMWLSELVGRSGSIDCLEFVVDYGAAPLTEDTCYGAASGGHMAALEWLRKVGCPWDHHTLRSAAKGGHLGILKYALDSGCPLDPAGSASPQGAGVAAKAAEGGHRRVLEWLVSRGCKLDGDTCRAACRNGDLHLLFWARENGAPWDGSAYLGAAEGGHVGVLNVLRQMGCPWDFPTAMRVLVASARNGRIDGMEWAVTQGANPAIAPDLTLAAAASGDGGAALRWCRGRGAPYHPDVCLELAIRGDLPTLQWAREDGADFGGGSGKVARAARARGHERLAVWVERKGVRGEAEGGGGGGGS